MLAWLADRAASTLLMLAAAALLAWPMSFRRARMAWAMLVVLVVAYGLALNLQAVNFPHSNFIHYYLGAKYPAPYADTYRLIHAGQGRPQIGMRDLEHPQDLVRNGTWLAPQDGAARRRRAIALASLGRLDEGLREFARAVALAPDDAAAHDDYGRALLMSGRAADGAREIEAALGLSPNDPQIVIQLASVRLHQGRRPEAVTWLTRARELAPKEPAIAEALAQLGNR